MKTPTGDPLQPGSVAPDFMLCDQESATHALADYRGNWVLLCFYPHDTVVKCAKEILAIRDHFEEFKKLGIRMFGISTDSVENHKQFSDANKLPFPLLSDADTNVAQQYHALAREQFFDDSDEIKQMSFLINVAGEIEKIYQHIKPGQHANEVLADFVKMQQRDGEEKESIEI
jgi:peroxiredoxin Q/BCP